MKKILAIITLIGFVSCYNIKFVAPPQSDVKVMSEVDVGKVKVSKKVWFILYGLVPLTDNSTADLIAKYNLKNVKARCYMDAVDVVIGLILGYFTIGTFTIEVEGEPQSK
ncbi:MAG: hypothetical protein ABDH49_04410 [Candidatus Hydrothermales bacterium]